jgi:hypothetical protein
VLVGHHSRSFKQQNLNSPLKIKLSAFILGNTSSCNFYSYEISAPCYVTLNTFEMYTQLSYESVNLFIMRKAFLT